MPKPVKKPDVEVIDLPEALRGGRGVDESLLDDAVAHINQVYVRKGMETVVEVGRYVLETFFDDDPKNFREHAGDHASFRELAKRDDLHMSHVWIWRAVSIVDQLQALPEGASEKLPYTHHTLLLPVRSDKEKARLAEKAIESAMTKRDFEKEVAKVRAKEKGDSKAGRPPLPAYQKTIHKIEKLVENTDDLWGGLDDLGALDADEATRLWQAVTGMKLRCEEVQKALQEKIPGWAPVQ